MTDIRERIARAIEAKAEAYKDQANYWGLPTSKYDRLREETMREAARIARDVPAQLPSEAADAMVRDVIDCWIGGPR